MISVIIFLGVTDLGLSVRGIHFTAYHSAMYASWHSTSSRTHRTCFIPSTDCLTQWYGQLTAFHSISQYRLLPARSYLISSCIFIESSKSSLTPVSTRRTPVTIVLRGLVMVLLLLLLLISTLIIPLPMGRTLLILSLRTVVVLVSTVLLRR